MHHASMRPNASEVAWLKMRQINLRENPNSKQPQPKNPDRRRAPDNRQSPTGHKSTARAGPQSVHKNKKMPAHSARQQLAQKGQAHKTTHDGCEENTD